MEVSIPSTGKGPLANLAARRAHVELAGSVPTAALVAAVKKAGFGATPAAEVSEGARAAEARGRLVALGARAGRLRAEGEEWALWCSPVEAETGTIQSIDLHAIGLPAAGEAP